MDGAAGVDLRALKLVLTAACNLKCGYCYQNEKRQARMSWDVVRVSLDRLLATRRPDVDLLFIGGEPLLEFPMMQRAVDYVEQHRRRDLEVRYAIITNGLLMGARETAFLIEHDFDVELSFDGVPPAQRLRGAQTFDRLDALLDSLRTDEPRFFDRQLRVNITLTPATIPYLADSVEYFLFAKRIQGLTIGPQITTTPDWRTERIEELDAAFRRVFRLSLQRLRETGDVPLYTFRKGEPEPAGRRTEMAMCGVGRGDQVAVDVDGTARGCLMQIESYQVYPTIFLKSRVDALRIGDIRDGDLDNRLRAYPAAVERAAIFTHKERKYSSYGRCGDCRFMSQCSICPMSLGRQPGDTDPHRVPDFGCAFNLVSLKYRHRFPRAKSVAERLTAHLFAPLPPTEKTHAR